MKLLRIIILFLVITSCKKTVSHLSKISAKNIPIDSTIAPSKTIDDVIQPYKEKLISDMEEVLCYSPKKIIKSDGDRQSSLGNLMADMCFVMGNPVFKEKTNESIDFVLLNHGGIRANMPKGAIMKEHAFKLMPFENELVVLNLTGEKVSELINFFIKKEKAHPLCKNIALTIFENGYDLKIKGKDFDKNKNYNVLTNDYLQNGGSQMDFFKNPKKTTVLDYKMRDAIIDYLKKTDTLHTAIDNRITIK